MPRLARVVVPDIPYHITQRGNRREDVFFTSQDRVLYLKWLYEYCLKFEVEIWAYCLMTNHIHLILKPSTEEGLQQVLKPLHMRYAQYINKQKGWKGHLWQGRFFSSALDELYTYSAIRYVERNPVSAGMVERAEDYIWSSAAAHIGKVDNVLLSDIPDSYCAVKKSEWSDWLASPEDSEHLIIIRRNIEKGLPCGVDGFIAWLEGKTNRCLQFKKQGRPGKG